MIVYVASSNPTKLRAVRDTFTEWYAGEQITAHAIAPPAGLPEQPFGEEVARGAVSRAMAAIESTDADCGVGIEAGLVRCPGTERWLSVQICAVADRDRRTSLGLGPGYELPAALREAVLAGAPLREALRLTHSVDDTDHRGAIHFLSDGRLDRYRISREAVRMALLSAEQGLCESP